MLKNSEMRLVEFFAKSIYLANMKAKLPGFRVLAQLLDLSILRELKSQIFFHGLVMKRPWLFKYTVLSSFKMFASMLLVMKNLWKLANQDVYKMKRF